jgi:hypothetical protein
MLRKPLTVSLIALVAAGPFLTVPALADASVVFYRGTEHAFVQPVEEDAGTGTPPSGNPANENPSGPLQVAVSKPTGSVAYGSPFELKFEAAGGKGAASWSTVYKGPRDSRLTIVESSGGVVITGRLPGGSYGPFWVSSSDGTTTVDSEKVTLVVAASPAVATFSGGGASRTVAAGAAWDLLVTATGGTAPYTYSPTTFTGRLAGITGTPEAGGFRLTGTPAATGAADVPIVITDALGGVTPTTLQVVSQETALEVTGLPSSVTSPSAGTG